MMNWKTEKALYCITEICKKSKEEYHLVMTGNEIKDYCKAKNEAYGYIPGVGGDKSYSCFAVLATI